MKFATRYAPPPPVVLACAPGSSKTRQEFAAESDINRLVERYQDTGSFYDPVTDAKAAARKPVFGDYTNVPDYQTALNQVIDAQQRFDSLPAKIRDRFHNSPQELLEFVSSASNREEAISLGLISKPVEVPFRVSDEKKGNEPPKEPPEAA